MNQSNTNPWWGIIGTREMGFRRSYQPFVALIGPSFPNSIDVFFWWSPCRVPSYILKGMRPARCKLSIWMSWSFPNWWWLEHGWIMTFHSVGNDHPNWRSPSFFRWEGGSTTNQITNHIKHSIVHGINLVLFFWDSHHINHIEMGYKSWVGRWRKTHQALGALTASQGDPADSPGGFSWWTSSRGADCC